MINAAVISTGMSEIQKESELEALHAELALLEKIQRDNWLLAFTPNPAQQRIIASDAYIRCLFGGNKVGKLARISDCVLTPTGWVTLGEVAPGDRIIAGDGSSTFVTGVFPQGKKKLYRFTFDDGANCTAGLEHQWLVKTPVARFRKGRSGYGEWSVLTTEEILKRYGPNPKAISRVSIPSPRWCEIDAQDVPLEPYLLGALLGDGGFSTGKSISFTKPDPDVIRGVANGLPDGHRLTPGKGKWYQFGIAGPGGGKGSNLVLEALNELELNGLHSYEKFVPEVYLWNEPAVRFAVLQGLLDTDGGPNNKGVEFCSTSEQLVDDVVFLTRSLGGKAIKSGSRITQYTHNGEIRDGRPSWRVNVRLPYTLKPFRSKAKLGRYKNKGFRTEDRVLHTIEEIGEDYSVCIAVDHPSHTYVTEDFIVTHNSTIGDAEDVSFCLGYRPYLPKGHPRYSTPFKPPVEVMVFGETWDKIDEIHTPKFEQLIPDGAAKPIKKQGYMRGWRFNNGSTIRYATYEMNPKRFEGADKHLYHFDEPPPYSIFSPVTRGTVVHGGMILLTLTLLSEGWIWDEIYEKADAGNPDYLAVVGDIRDNIYNPETGAGALSEKFIARFEDTLDDYQKEVRLHGKPQHLQGRIIKHFSIKEPWVVPEFEIPDDWPCVRSFDPHLQKPHAAVWVRVSPSGRLFVTDELFDSSIQGMDEMRSAVQGIEKRRRHRPALSLMDEAAAAPGKILESDSVIAIYKRYGIHCRPAARADRLTQIMNMAERFKIDPFTRQPDIVLFDSCKHLAWEIKRFVHPEVRNAAGLNRFKPLPEGSAKKDDDLIDCLKNIIARNPSYDGLQPDRMAYSVPPSPQVGMTFAEEYGTNWAGNGGEEYDYGVSDQTYR